MARAVAGVSSAGLMMHEQPAAKEAAILRAGVTAGKFHGEKAATGPTGSAPTIRRGPSHRRSTIPADPRPPPPTIHSKQSAPGTAAPLHSPSAVASRRITA